MPLPGLIGKGLFGSKSPKVLTELFGALDKEHKHVREWVIRYIADGNDPAGLGRLTPKEANNLSRQLLYGRVTGYAPKGLKKPVELSPEQWVRLGQVAMTVSAGSYVGTGWPAYVPEWFRVLQDMRRRWRWSRDGDWSEDHSEPAQLAQILAAGEEDPALVPQIIAVAFLKSYSSQAAYSTSMAEGWHRISDRPPVRALFEFLYSQASQIPGWLDDLPAEDRANAIRWLAAFPNLTVCVEGGLPAWATASSKLVRQAAFVALSALPEDRAVAAAIQALRHGSPARLGETVTFLTHHSAASRAALAAESQRPPAEGESPQEHRRRMEAIAAATQTAQAVEDLEDVDLAVPPVPPLDLTPLGDDAVDQLTAAVSNHVAWLQAAIADGRDDLRLRRRASEAARAGRGDMVAVVNWLNSTSMTEPRLPAGVDKSVLARAMADWPLVYQLRFATKHTESGTVMPAYELLVRGRVSYCDLRSMEAAWRRAGVEDPVEAVRYYATRYDWMRKRKPECIWPFFAEHPQWLEEALLGAMDRRDPYDLRLAFRIMRMFPSIHPALLPLLGRMATREAKTGRAEAQALLAGHPGCLSLALDALGSKQAATRAVAATWLGKIGDQAAAEPLRKALAKERAEMAQAAIISALGSLGDNVRDLLTPEALGAAAKKASTKAPPSSISWLNLDTLPACRWEGGSPVEPAVVKWLVELAARLKDPAGVGLIPIYVSLLDEPSRQALGRFALDAWIAWDTRQKSDAEARQYAQQEVDARYDEYQKISKQLPNDPYWAPRGALTREQVFEELRSQFGRTYLGSAIDSKGLLALASGASGTHVLEACQRFVKQHGSRRAQVEALVTAAATNPEPAALQFVLQIARKHRQVSVRDKAKELVETIAERRGWTSTELADRTIPTAGFDEAGLLELSFGPRLFTGRINRSPKTGAFGIELRSPSGQVIKALPKPAQSDDPEAAKEAKAQLTRSKKELAAIAKLQADRLYDAMCVSRSWDEGTWREAFLEHPIMRHLAATLVWAAVNPTESGAGEGAAGSGIGHRVLFRPTAEGELLDANDDALELDPQAQITLAHQVTCTAEETAAWTAHLADYGVKVLFEQFGAELPKFVEGAVSVDDHKGWVSDSFIIRNESTKRGYVRGEMVDGPVYDQYVKEFPDSGVRAIIKFTGAYVPEEKIPAAVTDLVFTDADHMEMPLAQVAPVLLAETYADYVKVAEAGSFDPEWESISVF
ncbi:MAG: DUF4132 domain-containing protein [Bifidobacteriaceae bacterium]|nr:DUF4132 domain-containing protein [Bifidobacteriaceae bacterium]